MRQPAACLRHLSQAGTALPAGPCSPASRGRAWEGEGDRASLGWDPTLQPARRRGWGVSLPVPPPALCTTPALTWGCLSHVG